ncbi:MAG: biotin--[acetyl-CoA-carboxylase] ligase [Bdellovibrionales bacterium]|nr:biotin--[acetyl-CoA-carboxylase] ligase [Bdellovibrionales bacterium]
MTKAAFPRNAVLDEVGSTNDLARVMGEEGAPHGSWISAKRQTGGRGRMGREWRSNEGNLFLSVVLRPPREFPMTWVPLAVALAVHETAAALRPDADLVLKWPNDLGVRDRKLGFRKVGGILCEGVGSASGSFVVAGIGVNCAIAPETDQPTASLGVDVEKFRPALLEKFPGLLSRPIEEIRADYARASLLRRGDAIAWRDLRLDADAPDFTGEFENYGDHGELLAREEGSAEIKRLYSEEIKLRLKR